MTSNDKGMKLCIVRQFYFCMLYEWQIAHLMMLGDDVKTNPTKWIVSDDDIEILTANNDANYREHVDYYANGK